MAEQHDAANTWLVKAFRAHVDVAKHLLATGSNVSADEDGKSFGARESKAGSSRDQVAAVARLAGSGVVRIFGW